MNAHTQTGQDAGHSLPWIKPLAPPKAKSTLPSTPADRMTRPEIRGLRDLRSEFTTIVDGIQNAENGHQTKGGRVGRSCFDGWCGRTLEKEKESLFSGAMKGKAKPLTTHFEAHVDTEWTTPYLRTLVLQRRLSVRPQQQLKQQQRRSRWRRARNVLRVC